MLDLYLRAEVPDSTWSALTHRVDDVGLDDAGPAALPSTSDRSHDRVSLHGRAITHRGAMRLGVRLRDLSFKGIGIASPLQLYPQERVTIELGSDLRVIARLRRCRRRAKGVYVCGLDFDEGPLTVPEFLELKSGLLG